MGGLVVLGLGKLGADELNYSSDIDLVVFYDRGRAKLADRVELHMSPDLPILGSGQPVADAISALEASDAIVVLVDGRPSGVLTRQDLLGFLTVADG